MMRRIAVSTPLRSSSSIIRNCTAMKRTEVSRQFAFYATSSTTSSSSSSDALTKGGKLTRLNRPSEAVEVSELHVKQPTVDLFSETGSTTRTRVERLEDEMSLAARNGKTIAQGFGLIAVSIFILWLTADPFKWNLYAKIEPGYYGKANWRVRDVLIKYGWVEGTQEEWDKINYAEPKKVSYPTKVAVRMGNPKEEN